MNLAMRAKDEKEALIKALEYYQGRLVEVETKNKALDKSISSFLTDLGVAEDIDDYDFFA